MKIDIFPHILPPKYVAALEKEIPDAVFKTVIQARCKLFPALDNLENRFSLMDKHSGLVQVLSLTVPFVERIVSPQVAIELTKLGNDEMAELVSKYPDRFVSAIGNLPMNDLGAALDEMDRIINDLNFRGIQISTDINGKPLDSPEFMPFYQKMESYDLPIFLHPVRTPAVSDYATEDTSKYGINQILGWPYDTSAAMIRLVIGQVLEKYPKLKLVTHHCGAMIPFFYKRIINFFSNPSREAEISQLSSPLIDCFKKFYADTALTGCTAGLMCGYAFFGADHICFGTDMPLGSFGNHSTLDDNVESIEQMEISNDEKQKIFSGNAIKLLKLPF
jgi:aminocarboxymuconate-semialdehyde decarboxylase